MSSPITFESLPNEVLSEICQQLYQIHHQSILTISLVSWQCRQTVIPLLFKTIKFTVVEGYRLKRDVSKYRELLEKSVAARHVRYLVISGPGEIYPYYNSSVGDLAGHLFAIISAWKRPRIFLQNPDQMSEIQGVTAEQMDDDVVDARNRFNIAFQPLADLIAQQLQNLTDVSYECDVPLPPVMFYALEKHHPSCRLYHHSFCLYPSRFLSNNLYQLNLITSQLLYSIRTVYYLKQSEDDTQGQTFNADFIQLLVSGAAPNLQRVMLLTATYTPLPEYEMCPLEIREAFDKAIKEKKSRGGRGVEVLALFLSRDSSTSDLGHWKQFTDLSCLKSLKIYGCIDDDWIEDLTLNYHFSSLEALFLMLDTAPWPDTKDPEFWVRVETLLLRLPQLTTLELSGMLMPMDRVLQHHGPALRKLNLASKYANGLVLSHEDAFFLVKLCPHLEHLQITTKRTQGDVREVQIYRELGKLSKLRDLTLFLDCSAQPVAIEPAIGTIVQHQWKWPGQRMFAFMAGRVVQNDANTNANIDTDTNSNNSTNTAANTSINAIVNANTDASTNTTTALSDNVTQNTETSSDDETHIRQTLVNSAVDQDLASSIFLTIAGSQSHLKNMQISTRSSGILFGQLADICQFWKRTLIVERNCQRSIEHANELLVTEPDKEARIKRMRRRRWMQYPNRPNEVRLVFNQIWPQTRLDIAPDSPDRSQWLSEAKWHSFPLCKEFRYGV